MQLAKKRNARTNCLQILPNKVIGSSVKEAMEIIATAENMGFSIVGDREIVEQEIARKLDDGVL